MLQPRFETCPGKKLVGIHLKMSLTQNRTHELWSQFMPRRNEIINRVNGDYVSLQTYAEGHYENFNPNNEFKSWACVEVLDHENIPDGMEAFELPPGEYAVFDYKGSSNDGSIFRYIYGEWVPQSEYELDNRPHFDVLGEKYKNNDPNSEEEIWIPIRPR